jgi:hypothetical protein
VGEGGRGVAMCAQAEAAAEGGRHTVGARRGIRVRRVAFCFVADGGVRGLLRVSEDRRCLCEAVRFLTTPLRPGVALVNRNASADRLVCVHMRACGHASLPFRAGRRVQGGRLD